MQPIKTAIMAMSHPQVEAGIDKFILEIECIGFSVDYYCIC